MEHLAVALATRQRQPHASTMTSLSCQMS